MCFPKVVVFTIAFFRLGVSWQTIVSIWQNCCFAQVLDNPKKMELRYRCIASQPKRSAKNADPISKMLAGCCLFSVGLKIITGLYKLYFDIFVSLLAVSLRLGYMYLPDAMCFSSLNVMLCRKNKKCHEQLCTSFIFMIFVITAFQQN